MTLREIKYLKNSNELKEFIEKYDLKVKIINNEKLYLIAPCFIFEIYSLVIEDFFYFDIYSIDLKYNSTLNRVLSDLDATILKSVYQAQITRRKQVIIPKLQGDEELTLKAEQYFFTMLQLMDEYLSDIISCKMDIRPQYYTKIFEYKKTDLKNVIENI